MQYKIKVGAKYLVGENFKETLNGTNRGNTCAVFSTISGEMSAYDFSEDPDKAGVFDRTTAAGYVEGLLERQNKGFYFGDIKLFPADQDETIVHCAMEKNARIIGMILDFDAQGKEFDWYEQHLEQFAKSVNSGVGE